MSHPSQTYRLTWHDGAPRGSVSARQHEPRPMPTGNFDTPVPFNGSLVGRRQATAVTTGRRTRLIRIGRNYLVPVPAILHPLGVQP